MMKTLSAVFLCCSLLFAAPSYGAGMDDAERIEKADALIKAEKYEEGRTLIEGLAAAGNARAENLLGLYYSKAKKDRTSACDWYEKAASQGFARAQYNLALCYEDGNGRPKNIKKTMKLYKESAEQGYLNAQFNYGNALVFGLGITKDVVKGREWFYRASMQGDLGAMYKLAETYKGTDRQQFLKWHRKAAEAGNMHSMFRLEREGSPNDKKKASKYLTTEVLTCLLNEAKHGDMYSNYCNFEN